MSNVKIIYSLRIHMALQRQGFVYLTEMKNPQNQRFNCWVYEKTPELLKAFDALVGGERNFIMRGEWLNNFNGLPLETRDKIIADIVRYGVGQELEYGDDPVIASIVNMTKSSIDASKNSYDKKLEMSKTAGRKKIIDDNKILELARKGLTAQEIADELGVSKSSVDKSEGWKQRNQL